MKDKDLIKAEILFQKGVEETRSGNYTVAFKCFDEVSKLNPGSPEVWNNKALVLFSLGRYEEAVQCCDIAIKIKSRYPDPWDIKTRALAKLGKHKESIAAAEKFIELAPPAYAARVREAEQYIEKASALLMFDTVITTSDKGVSVYKKEKNQHGSAVSVAIKKKVPLKVRRRKRGIILLILGIILLFVPISISGNSVVAAILTFLNIVGSPICILAGIIYLIIRFAGSK